MAARRAMARNWMAAAMGGLEERLVGGGAAQLEVLQDERDFDGLGPAAVGIFKHHDAAVHGAIDRLKRGLEHLFDKKEHVRTKPLEFTEDEA